MRTDKNTMYHDRLRAYFYAYYGEYENKSEWFINPAPNQIKGYIPELRTIIAFTCDNDGEVTEEKELLTMELDKLYEIVEGLCRGMDAIYEDHLIELVGEEGFDILREAGLIELCGSIDGRRLYVPCGK